MQIDTLIAMLTEGLPADQAAIVKAAIERDATKAKVTTIKAQDEYTTLEQRSTQLQAELDGGPDKPGAKAYQQWYNENYAKVQQLQADYAKYEAKFGKLDASEATPNPANPAATYTKEDVQRMVDERIQTQYSPKWSELLTGTGSIVQKHMMAGRKVPIDFQKLSELAPKYGGNLEQAYEEWDKPEREKVETASKEAEITRRVNEELQKRGTSASFPAAADFGPSSLSLRSKADTEKFDPVAMKNDLAKTFMAGAIPTD